MPFNIGLPEMIVVLVIALIVLGPKKLPDFGKSLGNGMREFKDSVTGNSVVVDEVPEVRSAPAAARTTPAA